VTARELGAGKSTAAEPRGASPSQAGDGRAVFRLEAVEAVVTSSLTTTGNAEPVAPNVLCIAHWERILEGELYAATARIDWRTLLKRTFDTELRVCARCGGRLVIRAVVTDSASAREAPRRPKAAPSSTRRRLSPASMCAIRRALAELRLAANTQHHSPALLDDGASPHLPTPPWQTILRRYRLRGPLRPRRDPR
jgi:hypothetical protein